MMEAEERATKIIEKNEKTRLVVSVLGMVEKIWPRELYR